MESVITENNKEAKLFIDKMMVDSGTIKQIRSMIKHEAIENARIMPDCHKGVGCCIGFISWTSLEYFKKLYSKLKKNPNL